MDLVRFYFVCNFFSRSLSDLGVRREEKRDRCQNFSKYENMQLNCIVVILFLECNPVAYCAQ
uniref:Uncharacterized protein n=1 Tax=Candidatus Kentrum sp. FW TaxID=2126338 RepID=A0A450SUJ3_9GAMM|nr:MAG: hypothetical protein BECKFW1821A_GA0114235_103119 [Candidatus Kentron sp. FW]VFJ57638.1 MAG: hypothetical protein BECKFW1821B_GA0114236_103526 [Candidatus Kentron sp. FW]VFJ73473.1 MAG: hypothetical protein BECKFW1821C_GA0114237_10518 [Candidatus Kentron sp. FW]